MKPSMGALVVLGAGKWCVSMQRGYVQLAAIWAVSYATIMPLFQLNLVFSGTNEENSTAWVEEYEVIDKQIFGVLCYLSCNIPCFGWDLTQVVDKLENKADILNFLFLLFSENHCSRLYIYMGFFFLFLRHSVVTRINVLYFLILLLVTWFFQLTVERIRKHSMLVFLYKPSFVLYVWHTLEEKMWIQMISIVSITFNILWWLN